MEAIVLIVWMSFMTLPYPVIMAGQIGHLFFLSNIFFIDFYPFSLFAFRAVAYLHLKLYFNLKILGS